MRRRLLLRCVLATLGIAGSLLVVPSGANAVSTECGSTGRICVWTGPFYESNYQAYATQVNQFPTVRNNTITSIWNRYSESWIFYAEPDFVEPLVCVAPGASVVSLQGYAGLDNNIESARRTGTTTCPSTVPRSFDSQQCVLSGRVCVWNGTSFTGVYGAYSLQVTVFPPTFYHNVWSIWNRYSESWNLYDDAGSVLVCVFPNGRVYNLYPYSSRIASMHRTGSTTC